MYLIVNTVEIIIKIVTDKRLHKRLRPTSHQILITKVSIDSFTFICINNKS